MRPSTLIFSVCALWALCGIPPICFPICVTAAASNPTIVPFAYHHRKANQQPTTNNQQLPLNNALDQVHAPAQGTLVGGQSLAGSLS